MAAKISRIKYNTTTKPKKKYVWVCFVKEEDYGESKRGPVEYVCDSQRKADKWMEKRQEDCDELDDGENAYATKIEVN